MRNFYNLFGLTVDYCKQDNRESYQDYFENKKKEKECFDCYKADIVYGDSLSFEGDILRTNFMGINGRGKQRNFDCIIIFVLIILKILLNYLIIFMDINF